jgi:protein SCO1/2
VVRITKISVVAAMLAVLGSTRIAADNTRWGANYFPNVTLTTQDGVPVRFYDDLIKGKIVAINLIYTTCEYACPLETARLAQVQKVLGDRMGRDVFFYSITIDPEHDTPGVLKEYAKQYQAGPGWLFLTGTQADIDLLSKKLGLYSRPDPSNPDGHLPYLLVGNEATGQWLRNSATDNAKFLARTIGDWLKSWQDTAKPEKSHAEIPRVAFDKGQYMFASHCAACHTLGRGDFLGPDLAGVTAARERAWLTRFIVEPDKVMAEKDPIALALRDRFKQVRMPNLDLTEEDADVIIEYMARQSRAVHEETRPAEPPKPRVVAAAPAVDLTSIVNPYLQIQRALNADRVEGIEAAARTIAAEVARFGSGGNSIGSAARTFRAGGDLEAARVAMGRLSDAILDYAKTFNAGMGADVNVAYCPMVRKSWLQAGDKIQNPYYGQEMSECGRITTASAETEK